MEDAEKLASLKTNLQKENQTTTLPIQMIFNGNQLITSVSLPLSTHLCVCVCIRVSVSMVDRVTDTMGIKPRVVNMLAKDSNTELSPNL